jgi:hypothetical protein
MNAWSTATDAVKLAISLAALLVFGLFAWWIMGKFNAANTLAEIKTTGKVLQKAAVKADKANAARDAGIAKNDAAIQTQIDAMKATKDELLRAELDRPLHPERVRLINCALRGAESEGDCQPQSLRREPPP